MQRDSTVDFLKGIAIFLVVIGHFNPVQQVGDFIYSFHMPLFFFLSGITFWYSFGKKLNRENSKKLIFEMFVKKICSLCLPYAAWSGIRFWVCGDNIAESFDRLWFLPTLLGIILIFAAIELAALFVSPNGSEVITFCIEILLSAFFCFAVLLLMEFTEIKLFREILIYVIPFYIGFALKKYNFIQKIFDSQLVITLSLIVFCILVSFYSQSDKSITVLVIRYITGICFTVVLYYAARIYVQGETNQKLFGIFEFLGKNTLKIYIIHDFFRPVFLYNVAVTFWDIILKIIGSAVISIFSILIANVLAQSNIIGFVLFGERKNRNNKLSEVTTL